MGLLIYSLCALTSLACSVLLWRAYAQSRARLLFWSALCFGMLTVNNVFLVLDKEVFADIDFKPWRLASSFVAICLLLFGLIWEED